MQNNSEIPTQINPAQPTTGNSATLPSDNSPNDNSYYQHARPEILEMIPDTARRILDVGCGAGVLGALIKANRPTEVHGIELTADASNIAKSRLDRVWNSAIEHVLPELANGYYDCIVVADVLEHLVDPWSVLRTLKTKLAPKGKVVASLPNIQNWEILANLIQGKWDYQGEGILDRTHLRFFTRKSVEELFWTAGLHISHFRGKNSDAIPPQSILKSLRNAGFEDEYLRNDGQIYQFLLVGEDPEPIMVPKVSVVVLNWNGKRDTTECLESLQRVNYHNLEIIVVDNGSTDESVAEIHERFPDVVILETGANLGYSGGNNYGIKWALGHGADYLLLLNNDTIVDPTLLSAYIDAANIVPNAIFGANIYYYDRPDVLWFAGGQWQSDQMRFEHIGLGQMDGPEFSQYRQCDYVTGCALFAKADIFRKIGPLDDNFFLTYEETDWCYRARKLGYRCIVVPHAKLWHKVSASFGGNTSPLVSYFMTRNLLLWGSHHLRLRQRVRLMFSVIRELRMSLVPRFQIKQNQVFWSKATYWALVSQLRQVNSRFRDPVNRATLLGLRDYFLRRFGDCPAMFRPNKKI